MKALKKYAIVTGLVIGLWNTVIFMITSWIVSKYKVELPSYAVRQLVGLFSLLILIIGIYLGLRVRKQENNNFLSYKEAILSGIRMSLIIAVIVSLFSLVYCEIINPDFANDMLLENEKTLRASKATSFEVAEKLKQVKMEFSTPMQVMMALVGQTIIGTISSLIFGFFLRTKNN